MADDIERRARCGTCREERDRCKGFVFDLSLADGTELRGVRLQGAGGVHGSGYASQANRGDTVDLERCAATLLRQVSGEAEARGFLRAWLAGGVEVCISAVPLACRPVVWPRALCRCCGRPSVTDRLLALGLAEAPSDRADVIDLLDTTSGEPVSRMSPGELAAFLAHAEQGASRT